MGRLWWGMVACAVAMVLFAAPAEASLGTCTSNSSLTLWSAKASVNSLGQVNFSGKQATITSSTPALTGDQLANNVAAAEEDTGVCTGPGAASMFDQQNYRGTCWDFLTSDGSPQTILDFNATYFPGHHTQSVAIGGACGSQLLLYENPFYDTVSTTNNCSGFGCFPYVAGCTVGAGSCSVPSHTGKMLGVSVSDASLSSIPNPAEVPWAQDPDFSSFGVSSAIAPTGGIAALYDQPNYQGNCATLMGDTTYDHLDNMSDPSLSPDIGDNKVRSYQLLRGCQSGFYFFSGRIGDGAVVGIDDGSRDEPALSAHSMSSSLDQWSSVWTEPNYRGTCTWLPPGNTASILLHDATIGSARIGVQCPSPAGSVYLYRQANFGGSPLTLYGAANDLRTQGFNDAAASLVNSTDQTVSVYSDVHDRGTCINVPGNSNFYDLDRTIVGDGTVSSVAFGSCPPAPVIGYGTRSATLGTTSPVGDQSALNAVIPAGDAVRTISNHLGNAISIYSRTGFRGGCQTIPAGKAAFVRTSPQFSVSAANEMLADFHPASMRSSRACPSAVELFDFAHFKGSLRSIQSSTSNLGTSAKTATSVINNTGRTVALYSVAGYRGRCQTLPAGQQLTTLAGSEIGNNEITSVLFGRSCKQIAILFQFAGYHGSFLGVGADKPDLTAYLTLESSLVNNTGHTISLYRKTSYTGACQNVPANTGIPTLRNSIVHPGSIRSIKLSGPCPAVLTLFTGAHFTGRAISLKKPIGNLARLRFGRHTIGSIVDNTSSPVNLYSAAHFAGACERVFPAEAFPDTTGTVPRPLPLSDTPIVSVQPTVADDDGCPPVGLVQLVIEPW